jgi:cell wall-associated NlpC family hydrolase
MFEPTASGLARAAWAALGDPAFESRPGYCERFVREVIQSVFAHDFDGYFQATAYATMQAFTPSQFCRYSGSIIDASDVARGSVHLQAGDLLFKGPSTSGPYGHVAILLSGAVYRVAENSSYHLLPGSLGDVSGAKGWRSLLAFGPFEAVVRLI